MRKRFRPGDRVRIIRTNGPHLGKETIVTDGPREGVTDTGMLAIGYEVDLPNDRRDKEIWPRAWFRPEHLVLLYDGDKPAKWSDLAEIWKPAGISS